MQIISIASLEHLQDEVNEYFSTVVVDLLRTIHKRSLCTEPTVSHLTRLCSYLEELCTLDEVSVLMHVFVGNHLFYFSNQGSSFARADLKFTLPNGSTEKVFTFRYENVKGQLSFSKKQLLNAVAFGKLGVTNKRKTIGTSHDKCTLVFLSSLPAEVQQKVIEG